MSRFNPQNINKQYTHEAYQIADYYKKMEINKELGSIGRQIINSDFNVSIEFSEGYILTILTI
jgi:hypothetical protein